MNRLILLISSLIILCINSSSAYAQYGPYSEEEYLKSEFINSLIPAFSIKEYDQRVNWEIKPGPRFNAYIDLGGQFGNLSGVIDGVAGFDMDVVLGARINPWFFTGGEIGVCLPQKNLFDFVGDVGYGTKMNLGYIPVAWNFKGLLPVGKNVCPYLDLSLGAAFGIADLSEAVAFDLKTGAGFEFNRFCLTAGYNGIFFNGLTMNLGYVKLGIRLGW